MKIIKTDLDIYDLDIILCEDLIDHSGEYYNLTLKQALDEQLAGESLLHCNYVIDMPGPRKRLISFLGYSQTKVIFTLEGIGIQDKLLTSLPRNPM